MEAKEKAIELISSFKSHVDWLDDDFHSSYTIKLKNQKECALILVNELIKHIHLSQISFWEDVKKEIINYKG